MRICDYSKQALRTANEGHLLEMTNLVRILEECSPDRAEAAHWYWDLLEQMKAASQRDEAKALLMYNSLGLAGESGEVADYVKKAVGHGHALNPDVLAEELGDVLWYINRFAHSIKFSLAKVARRNIDKLKKRYPEGFSSSASKARIDKSTTG